MRCSQLSMMTIAVAATQVLKDRSRGDEAALVGAATASATVGTMRSGR